MFSAIRTPPRAAFVISCAAGMIIAIWLTAQLAGWDEDRVSGWIPQSSALAAIVICGLLIADTVMPIPATIVMLASGAVLGPVAGAAVNAVGLGLAALAGYALGWFLTRRSEPSENQRDYSGLMVAATRGLPVLSESVAIGAGALRFPLARFTRYSLVGAVAAGGVWSIAGSLATNHWSLILLAAAMAAIAFLVVQKLDPATRSTFDNLTCEQPHPGQIL